MEYRMLPLDQNDHFLFSSGALTTLIALCAGWRLSGRKCDLWGYLAFKLNWRRPKINGRTFTTRCGFINVGTYGKCQALKRLAHGKRPTRTIAYYVQGPTSDTYHLHWNARKGVTLPDLWEKGEVPPPSFKIPSDC